MKNTHTPGLNVQRQYANEVLADTIAGIMPNLSVTQRACAQVEELRAVNAELLAALADLIAVAVCAKGRHYTRFGEPIAKARAAIAKSVQS